MNDNLNAHRLKKKNINFILIGVMKSAKFADDLLEQKGHTVGNVKEHAEFMSYLDELRNLILDFKDKAVGE